MKNPFKKGSLLRATGESITKPVVTENEKRGGIDMFFLTFDDSDENKKDK